MALRFWFWLLLILAASVTALATLLQHSDILS